MLCSHEQNTLENFSEDVITNSVDADFLLQNTYTVSVEMSSEDLISSSVDVELQF